MDVVQLKTLEDSGEVFILNNTKILVLRIIISAGKTNIQIEIPSKDITKDDVKIIAEFIIFLVERMRDYIVKIKINEFFMEYFKEVFQSNEKIEVIKTEHPDIVIMHEEFKNFLEKANKS